MNIEISNIHPRTLGVPRDAPDPLETLHADSTDGMDERSAEHLMATASSSHGAGMGQLRQGMINGAERRQLARIGGLVSIFTTLVLPIDASQEQDTTSLQIRHVERADNVLSARENVEWSLESNELDPRHIKKAKRNMCNCTPFAAGYQAGVARHSSWTVGYELQSLTHRSSCPLSSTSTRTTTTKLRMISCGTIMRRVIEASISISRGLGVFSISPELRCTHVVPYNSPAFQFVNLSFLRQRWTISNEEHLSMALQIVVAEIEELFRDRAASPYDVDPDGNTLLHVRF